MTKVIQEDRIQIQDRMTPEDAPLTTTPCCLSAIPIHSYFNSFLQTPLFFLITLLDYTRFLIRSNQTSHHMFLFEEFLHKLIPTLLTSVFPYFFNVLGSSESNPAGYIIFATTRLLFLTGKFTFSLPQISSMTTFKT